MDAILSVSASQVREYTLCTERTDLDTGRDGVHFNPYGAHAAFDVEAVTEKNRLRLSQILTTPGWGRSWRGWSTVRWWATSI